MGRERRHFEKNAYYVVKNTCVNQEARITPTPELVEGIRGLVAKYAEQYNIKYCALIFTPNGFKFLLRSPDQNIQQFMCVLQSSISREVNLFHQESGVNWGGRYSAERVYEDAIEEVFGEVIGQACMDNLVAHPSEWRGVSCWEQLLSGEPFKGKRVDTALYWRLRGLVQYANCTEAELRELATVEYSVPLTPIPGWEDLSQAERAQKIEAIGDEYARRRELMHAARLAHEAQLSELRADGGACSPETEEIGESDEIEVSDECDSAESEDTDEASPGEDESEENEAEEESEFEQLIMTWATMELFLPPGLPTMDDIAALGPHQRLARWKPMCRTHCHTFVEEKIKEFRKELKRRNKAYTESARRLRRGEAGVYFPDGMIPPGHLHCVGSPGAKKAKERSQQPVGRKKWGEAVEATEKGDGIGATG